MSAIENGDEWIEIESGAGRHHQGAEGDELSGQGQAHLTTKKSGTLIEIFGEKGLVNVRIFEVEAEKNDSRPLALGSPEERAQVVEVANLQFPQGL